MNQRRRLAVLCAAASASAIHHAPAGAQITTVATGLNSFFGIEDPSVIYDPTNQVFHSDSYQNIVDEGNQGAGEMFRFTLRYYPTPQTAWPGDPSTFWDGNQGATSGSDSTDRQRAEVKGLGAFQQLNTSFEYSFSFETDPNFVGTSGFCHIFQLKAVTAGGSDPGGDPVVTLSLQSNGVGELELYSPDGTGQQITIARTFHYTPNTWENADIKITTSTTNGSVMASINGDAMQGVSGVPVYFNGMSYYRPKWGFYRKIDSNLFDGINYLQDQDISATNFSNNLTWNNSGAPSPADGQIWDVGQNNWNSGLGPTEYFNGATIAFNDANNDHYAVTLAATVTPASVTVNNSAGNYSFTGSGKIAGTGSFTKSGSGTLTLGNVNKYTGGTNVTSGTLIAAVAGAIPIGGVQITGGTLQLGANTGAAQFSSLSINGNGVLDINNNHLIIAYGSGDPIATIAGYLKSGYNAGTWTGHGINSSAAAADSTVYGLGYADAADPGNPAGLSSGTIEIEYTLLGDADLNRLVNGIDFGIVAANFNQSVTRWDQGDFDYNNIVNGVDFGDLATNFNRGASGSAAFEALESFAAANGLLADVPEPASITLLAIAAGNLAIRRRRN